MWNETGGVASFLSAFFRLYLFFGGGGGGSTLAVVLVIRTTVYVCK